MALHLHQRGKSLRTIWAELGDEFPEIINLCSAQTIENASMDQEMKRRMTVGEEERYKADTPRETITEGRIWNKRPDGLAIKMSTSEKLGAFVTLEFKRMSDVTDRYVKRAKRVAIAQYVSIKSALEQTLDRQGWLMNQRSFIVGVRSLNEKDLQQNRAYFKVPQVGIESEIFFSTPFFSFFIEAVHFFGKRTGEKNFSPLKSGPLGGRHRVH